MPHTDRRQPPFDPALVRAVAAAAGSRQTVDAAPWAGLDPEAFVHLARYWHVAPRLWLELRARTDLPSSLRDALRTEYWRNTQANAILREAVREISSALNARGIVPLLLKGGCQLFDPPSGHAGTRFMVDLDLLAPPGFDRPSFDILCGMGFAPDGDGDRRHHCPRLRKRIPGLEDDLAVEVHRTPWIDGGPDVTAAFFAASQPIDEPTIAARLPCTIHRALNNVAHAFPGEGRFSYYAVLAPDDFDEAIGCTDLKQLLDFADLCRFRSDRFDWQALVNEADRFGRRCDLQQWAYLARELFAISVPAGVARWNVDRRVPQPIRTRCRRAAKAVLRRARLLGPTRRLKARWLS
ncbi:MAG: nucleotidyltransferase family protein [Vicinamibacterales bacterium]